MPQVDVYYTVPTPDSKDPIELQPIFKAIENCILAADADAGQSKSRAHRITEFLHPHVFIDVKLIKKQHRTEHWLEQLGHNLEVCIKQYSEMPCQLNISFLGPQYRSWTTM